MLYRQAGVFHSGYVEDRRLFPLAFDRVTLLVLMALALLAPVLWESAISGILTPWLIWVAAALGLNLIVGWAGQFHFGYAAIMGIGAYASVHAARHGFPWEVAILLGGAAASVIGIAFSFAALRVKGLYLALSTLALQFAMDWVISHVSWIGGGTQATLQAPPPALLGIAVNSNAAMYYLALAWCVMVTFFMLNLKRTGFGRALVAVREKDYAASILGVNSLYYKCLAFSTSSFIGGVSGALLIFLFYHAVTPEQFAVNVSIQILAMVIVGGLTSIIGSYLGVAFILLLPGQLNHLFSGLASAAGWKIDIETLAHLPHVAYGLLIIGFLLIEPMGLGKLYANVRNYFLVWPFGHAR